LLKRLIYSLIPQGLFAGLEKVYRYGPWAFLLAGLLLGSSGSYIFGGLATKNLQLLPFLILFILGPLIGLMINLVFSWNTMGQKKTHSLLLFSTGYMVSSFLVLVWTYMHKTVGVEFQTTFPEFFHHTFLDNVVFVLGYPLQLIGWKYDKIPMLVFFQGQNELSHLARVYWRNWVLGTMFLYGIAPRLILLLTSFLLVRKAEKAVRKQNRLKQFAIDLEQDGDPFAIGPEELRLLLSLQAMIVRGDIEKEADPDKKKRKMSWYSSWKDLQTKVREATNADDGILKELSEDPGYLEKECSRLHGNGYHKIGLLLFEAALFTPYFPLQNQEPNKGSGPEDSSSFDAHTSERNILEIAGKAGFEQSKLRSAIKSYHSILDDLQNRKQLKSLGYWLGGAFLATGLGLALGPAFLGALGLKGAIVKLLSSLALGSGVLVLAKIGAAKGLLLVVCGGSLWSATHKIAEIYGFRGGAERIVKDIAKFEATILHLLNLDYKDALGLIAKKLYDAQAKIQLALDDSPESQSKKELKKCQAVIAHRLEKMKA
jgi:hypothetical protein